MNLLDFGILLVLMLGAARGLLRGLIKETATFSALLLGGWLAFKFYEKVALLIPFGMPQSVSRILAFTALLVLVGLIAHLASNLLAGIVKLALLGWVDRLGGMLLGVAEGGFVLGLFFYTILSVPYSFQLKENVKKHPLTLPLAHFTGTVIDRTRTITQQMP